MKKGINFIEQIVKQDLLSGFNKKNLKFRFPPEPNGFLHIGHVKAICLNFNLGKNYGAPVNLRFDDTNPVKEDKKFVDAIKKDITWLGYKWEKECYASDYFDQLYKWAHHLIEKKLAYIDSQNSEQIALQKGTPTKSGTNSPYRNRSVKENKDLFTGMFKGEFKEGEHVLRAKIDMASSNMLLRDPVIYRVLYREHHRTKNMWCIYPLYDWTHGQSDYIEQISHSLCTLEFKPHRDLYDWFLDSISPLKKLRPKQREFARLNLSYTVTSKRKLFELIEKKYVNGWDDPRMPTLSGLKKRGFTPESIRDFCDRIGIAKRDTVSDIALLMHCLREDLNQHANRVMAVLDPIKVVITNYPEGKVEELDAINNPEDESTGTRKIPFSREIYIERTDFLEEPPKKYFRLSLGCEVRLKHAFYVTCIGIEKDDHGKILEIQCTYDPKTRGGWSDDGRKVKGTLHWVSVQHAVQAEVRLYDNLFTKKDPNDTDNNEDWKSNLNNESLISIKNCQLEPSLAKAKYGEHYQFIRHGYFIMDIDATQSKPVFNRTVPLRDAWARKKK